MAAFDSTNVETLSTASFTPPLLSPPRSVIEDDDGEAEGDNESGDEEESVVTDADERAQPQRQQQQGSTEEERIEKVTRNGMLYSKKKANLPYLKAHTWKEVEERKRQRQQQQQQQQQQQSRSRKEKEGSPPHLERTAEVSRSLLRYAVVLVLGTLLLSRMVTESWTFGYQGKWTNLNNWIPRQVSDGLVAVVADDAGRAMSDDLGISLLPRGVTFSDIWAPPLCDVTRLDSPVLLCMLLDSSYNSRVYATINRCKPSVKRNWHGTMVATRASQST